MVHNPFTSNNSLNIGSKNVDKGNLSITVTGDVMFGRKCLVFSQVVKVHIDMLVT